VSEHPSRAARVVFFEDRAEVVRLARCAKGAGVATVAVAGVTPLVHDPSLRVSAAPPVRVLSARVLRRLEQQPGPGASEIAEIEQDLRRARQRREGAERALARAQADEQRSSSLEQAWTEALRRVPDRAAEALDGLRAALGQIDSLSSAGLDADLAAREEVERARRDEARAQARLSLARTAQPRAVTLVEVQLDSPDAAEVDLELTYQTPCALWRPEHLARLHPGQQGQPERLELRTWATVWQRTGESWADVPCRFSTARPAQAASPPLLSDDVLVSRRKTAEEKKTVVVEAREQSIQVAGLGRGARAVDEMPGVEDGGEPLWLEGAHPATIPNDGQPVRIEVGQLSLPCKVERVAFPELTQMVHVRATATLAGKLPLLAGPVLLVRGTEAVGRGRTRFVAAGEPFELGFGADDGLRVRRTSSESRETVPILGTQKITRKVRCFASNLGGAARRLSVIERVPVSEIDGVQVHLLEGAAADRDGFVHAELELAPGATRTVDLSYRIEAGAKVQLPG
jgi:uncharacterized protein (TIGR02231 family)